MCETTGCCCQNARVTGNMKDSLVELPQSFLLSRPATADVQLLPALVVWPAPPIYPSHMAENFIPVAICLNAEPGERRGARGQSRKISGCSTEQFHTGRALSERRGWPGCQSLH